MMKSMNVPKNVVAIALEGKIDEKSIQDYEDQLESKLSEQSLLGLCVDITSLTDITQQGIVEGAKADLDLLSHIDRFERIALVSDKEWPQAVITMITPLMPDLSFKVFPSSKRNQALVWSAESTESNSVASADSGIKLLRTTREDVFAFEFTGKLTGENLKPIIDEVDSFLNKHEKVSMIAYMNHFDGFNPRIFMQSGLFGMKMNALNKLERYAIIGAPGWMAKMIGLFNPMFPKTEIRSFSKSEEKDALNWLNVEIDQ